MNNIPTSDTSEDVKLQFESFLATIQHHSQRHKHKIPNRVVICPLLYAPKFCDARLSPHENHLSKILEINQWIKKFNENTTQVHIELDAQGVASIPKSAKRPVEHVYDAWNEPTWQRMLHLNSEAKSKAAQVILRVFSELDVKLTSED